MITPGGKVAVIDMELSYSLKFTIPSWYSKNPMVICLLEQIAAQTPTIQEDIFSVGAIFCRCGTKYFAQ